MEPDEGDERLYGIVAKELSVGRRDEDLWAKAFALSNGEENATKAQYIRLRVEELVERDRERKGADNRREQVLATQAAVCNACAPETPSRPWRRFWARTADYFVWGLVFGLIAAIWFPENKVLANPPIFGLLVAASWVPIEVFLLDLWGNTPGRALFKVKLCLKNGSIHRASLGQLFTRALRVWFVGMGAGLPIIGWITLIASYLRLKRKRITSWDESGGFEVRHGEIGWFQWVIAVPMLAVASIVGMLWFKAVDQEKRTAVTTGAQSGQAKLHASPIPPQAGISVVGGLAEDSRLMGTISNTSNNWTVSKIVFHLTDAQQYVDRVNGKSAEPAHSESYELNIVVPPGAAKRYEIPTAWRYEREFLLKADPMGFRP